MHQRTLEQLEEGVNKCTEYSKHKDILIAMQKAEIMLAEEIKRHNQINHRLRLLLSAR